MHQGSGELNSNNALKSNAANSSVPAASSSSANTTNINITNSSNNHNIITANNTTAVTLTSTPSVATVSANTAANMWYRSGRGGGRSSSYPEKVVGFLKYNQEMFYITEPYTIIGRNSSTSHVHFHVANSNLVSRRHFQVLYKQETQDFYLQCLSKNGIFVNNFLQRREATPLKLEQICHFRIPSTAIWIQFQSFVQSTTLRSALSVGGRTVTSYNNSIYENANQTIGAQHLQGISASSADEHHHHQAQHAPSNTHNHLEQQQPQHHQTHRHHQTSSGNASGSNASTSNVKYSPLKISIPKKEQKSPYLSPTGAASASNSCPTSPRQIFHQRQALNNSNNNIENLDLFQKPSTSQNNHTEKPPFSYAQLIVQAITASPHKQLTLSGIYSFIVNNYPYYRKETNKGWQNSIRHNLSLNRYFFKVARLQNETGKGSYWRIDPDNDIKLIDHSYRKRRQRISQGTRPSPSQMDNSHESSSLQDIVLQSASGSQDMFLENRAADNELFNSSQNMHQGNSNNSHNPYSGSSSYYITSNQNSTFGRISGSNQQQEQRQQVNNNVDRSMDDTRNGVGAHMAAISTTAITTTTTVVTKQQNQQQQTLHSDMNYEIPNNYSGNMESGDDECDESFVSSTTTAHKRAKYIS